jgi:hypothetical protein
LYCNGPRARFAVSGRGVCSDKSWCVFLINASAGVVIGQKCDVLIGREELGGKGLVARCGGLWGEVVSPVERDG